ncbi:lipoate--protein ligase family protein [Candidatus Acetothermia bacterium]|nr:lipoate--protein ligase family protein [Candidatus Acetothermia bacterium]MBI3644079.1 lipoate--protein ligase family protein [Candidatus Acetothermia bacterium]
MALNERWRFLTAEFPSDPAFNYALENSIAEHVGARKVLPTLRLWQPGRCLAVGRFDVRLPRFETAVQQLKAQKIRVIQRISGGKAVWQERGYLNFSVIAPRTSLGIPESYRQYSEGLIRGFRALGVESRFEHVEGAFCDGPYDLATGGQKLVGTAQVQKKSFVIVHGTILVDCDIHEMVHYVSEFYRHAGGESSLRAETMISLVEAAGRKLTQSEIIDAIHEGYQSSLGVLVEEENTSSELELAKAHRQERDL